MAKINNITILATVNGFKIATHPTLYKGCGMLIEVDGEWFATSDYDIPDIESVKWIVSEIRKPTVAASAAHYGLAIDRNGTVLP